jgi:hypothetical protein
MLNVVMLTVVEPHWIVIVGYMHPALLIKLFLVNLIYCEQTLSEEQSLFKCVYSMMLIIQISILLYKMEDGRNRVGSKQKRGRERKR